MTVRVLVGDCRAVLPTLPDGSVHCVVTSPPYFGLRDYGVDGQIGLEATPAEFIGELVTVFRELWRVLRDDGVVWLNLGDSYASDGGHSAQCDSSARVGRSNVDVQNAVRGFRPGLTPGGIKTKSLIGIPWRVAFALQDDGWILRRDVIWHKSNPMPESIEDRPTTGHEYLFMLVKSNDTTYWTHRDKPGTRSAPSPDYRWVQKRELTERDTMPEGWDTDDAIKKRWRRINLWAGHDYFYDATAVREVGIVPAGTQGAKGSAERAAKPGVNSRPPEYKVYNGTRNLRSVWTIATKHFGEAHFATFPPELAETCINACTSERGCCRSCGAPWARATELSTEYARMRSVVGGFFADGKKGRRLAEGRMMGRGQNRQNMMRDDGGIACKQITTVDWRPTCGCDAGDPVPCLVLDPFGGAGTVGVVADRLQRDAMLVELNPEYADMARRRMAKDCPLFADVS
jgi:DNA modification methylase